MSEPFDDLFLPTDDADFVAQAKDHLKKGGHQLHSLSPERYVEVCRKEWASTPKDPAFLLKLLIDKRLEKQREATRPGPFAKLEKQGFERYEFSIEPDSEIYAMCMALMDEDGSYVGAPPGYVPPEHPKDGRYKVGQAGRLHTDVKDPSKPGTYLLSLLDVLGFEHMLGTLGIDAMASKYSALIDVAVTPAATEKLLTPSLSSIGDGLYVPGMFWLPLEFAYFSDTILLWTPYNPVFVAPFLSRCAAVFCRALELRIPLRGAIAVGTMVLHKQANRFLGEPLVEAARLEKAQEWIGAALGVSVRSESLRIPFDPTRVRVYDAPVKAGGAGLLSGLVLDWTREWKRGAEGSARDRIASMRSPGTEKYYDNAMEFVRVCEEKPDWFLDMHPRKPGTKRDSI